MTRFIIAIALLVSANSPAFAGTSGVVNGYARTYEGKPVPNASIKMVSASRAALAFTDSQGFFSILDLPPDTYTLSIERLDFSPGSFAGIRVSSEETTFLSIAMEEQRLCGRDQLKGAMDGVNTSYALDLREASRYPMFMSILPLAPEPSHPPAGLCL